MHSSKLESTDQSKKMAHHQRSSSLETLADLVSCSIHLGWLNDPRLLPCGHAFCCRCLDECLLKAGGTALSCPLCRSVISMPRGAGSLPAAFTHNQLLEYVIKKQAKHRKRSQSVELPQGTVTITTPYDPRSSMRAYGSEADSEENAWRLKQFLEARRQASTPNDDTITSAGYLTDSSGLTEDPSPSPYPDEDETYNLEELRKTMKKFSSFKICHKIMCECHARRSRSDPVCTVQHDVISADVVSESEGTYAVMIDKADHALVFRNNRGQVSSRLHIRDSQHPFHPHYVRVFDEHIYASGTLQSEEPVGILLKFTVDGVVVQRSDSYPVTDPNFPSVGGFSIDTQSGQIVLARPSESRIVVLSPAMVETSVTYSFSNLHPQYVTRKPDTEEVWASCPEEGLILVIDEKSGRFCKLRTQQIYNAVPSEIIYSTDQRILFLDSLQTRVFWIHKSNESILVQRLTLDEGPSSSRQTVTSMTALSEGRILFTSQDRVYIVKPSKNKNVDRRQPNCSLL